jgi:hypothetical protein
MLRLLVGLQLLGLQLLGLLGLPGYRTAGYACVSWQRGISSSAATGADDVF